MNLAEVKELFSSINLQVLNVTGRKPATSDYYHYDKLSELKRTINIFANIDYLKRFTDKLITSELYDPRGSTGGIAVSKESAKVIDENLSGLLYSAVVIENFLNQFLPVDKDDSIRIKLPPVRDFDDMAKVMNDLKKAIAIPLAEEEAGQIVIEHGESGSVWLFVYLGARKAVKLVAELGWAAMVILNKKNELNYVAEQVKAYKMGEEYISNLVTTQKQLLSQLVAGEALGVHNRINEDGKPLDPEAHQKLILSINTLADLYERGFKMLPSLSVREDVANLFPPSATEKLIESRNKQLPEGGNNSEGDNVEKKSS